MSTGTTDRPTNRTPGRRRGGPRGMAPTTRRGAQRDHAGRRRARRALVRQGRVYDLAHVLDEHIPAFPGPFVPPVPHDHLRTNSTAVRPVQGPRGSAATT